MLDFFFKSREIYFFKSKVLTWKFHFPDIDECTILLDACPTDKPFCVNTQGSYTCLEKTGVKTCPAGFKFDKISQQCKGNSHSSPPVLPICHEAKFSMRSLLSFPPSYSSIRCGRVRGKYSQLSGRCWTMSKHRGRLRVRYKVREGIHVQYWFGRLRRWVLAIDIILLYINLRALHRAWWDCCLFFFFKSNKSSLHFYLNLSSISLALGMQNLATAWNKFDFASKDSFEIWSNSACNASSPCHVHVSNR